MSVNYLIADFVSKLSVASKNHFVSIFIPKSKLIISILNLFYNNGLIRGFSVYNHTILVYLKYYNGRSIISEIALVSKPGKRIFWKLKNISNKYAANVFSGFYIISDTNGVYTSNECLLKTRLGGEVLIKIEI